jgi:hypothetical protein
MSEDLKAEFDAACLSGDFEAQERLGRQLYPEDGASPPARAPSADPPRDSQKLSAVEFGRQQREIHTEMQNTHPGSPRMQELQASLEALLQMQYQDETPATMTREAWRPDLPPGYVWDAQVVAGFEDTAPGGQTLMHVVADTLRSSTRRLDVGESWSALAQQHGEDEADALLRDADAYARAYLPARTYADLKQRKLINPELIYRAALFWRQRNTAGR